LLDVDDLNKRYHKHRKLPLTSDERKVIVKKKIKEKYEPKEEIEESSVQPEDFSLPTEDLGLEGLKQRLQVWILKIILFILYRSEFTLSEQLVEMDQSICERLK
jgi:hypothetical protein